MIYTFSKLLNGGVEIKNNITNEITILTPNKNVFLYKNVSAYNTQQNQTQNQLFIKISAETNYKLSQLGIQIPYDSIDFNNCLPPIINTSPESVIEQLSTNFFF